MSKASVITLLFLISVTVPICYGLLNPHLDGSTIVYPFTPYDGNGNVNLDDIPTLADFFAKRNIRNVHIVGFYGDGPILDLANRKAIALAWNKEAKRLKLNLIVEIGAMPFADQLEMAKFCNQLNVSAISAFPLFVYEAESKEEIIGDYQRLSDAAPNTSLMYDAYTETKPKLSPADAMIALMGRVKTLGGAIVSVDSALDIKASVPSVDGYQFWIYGSKAIATTYATKLNATVTAIPNLCPKAVLDIEALIEAGKILEALDLQQKLERLIQAIVSNNGKKINNRSRSYFKYMRAAFLIFHGKDLGARLPFEKATSTELDKIRCNLKGFEDFINCYCK